jgi:hypothetical protein
MRCTTVSGRCGHRRVRLAVSAANYQPWRSRLPQKSSAADGAAYEKQRRCGQIANQTPPSETVFNPVLSEFSFTKSYHDDRVVSIQQIPLEHIVNNNYSAGGPYSVIQHTSTPAMASRRENCEFCLGPEPSLDGSTTRGRFLPKLDSQAPASSINLISNSGCRPDW